ncbi:SDR family oxidoreductase [bacterium]|nr:SDR family oxidoreductase [bacterium]
MAEKVLVTGGGGYIGSVLVPHLLAAGHAVTVLDSFLWKQASLLDCCHDERFQVIRGDARDEKTLERLLPGHGYVIPLAALVGAPLCEQDRIGARTTNLDAIRSLARLASREQRILFPVTNSGYGIGEKDTPLTEESPLRPISLYGETKVAAEKLLLERGNVVTFRLATVFGMSPRMRTDLLVNDFTYRAVHDRAVVVFEGHFKRNYIHVRDVARVFLHGIERWDSMKDRAYNVGLDDANLSKLELCAAIKRECPRFTYLEAPIGEDPDKRDYIVSNARLAKTGFVPAFSLEAGIRELVKGFAILKNSSFGNV